MKSELLLTTTVHDGVEVIFELTLHHGLLSTGELLGALSNCLNGVAPDHGAVLSLGHVGCLPFDTYSMARRRVCVKRRRVSEISAILMVLGG